MATLVLALCMLAVSPAQAAQWGSPVYGDPPFFCPNQSTMGHADVTTNDPSAPTNPEQNTFYGFASNPGYEDWYAYFYGWFRGRPDDDSGWVYLMRVTVGNHGHWNFGLHPTEGWALRGHVKQYIAYYNWTFGGQCGMGAYGSSSPPPFMADQQPDPVVDFWVDTTPPDNPVPRVAIVTATSMTMTWDPVQDRGDPGTGRGYWAVGMSNGGGYRSWYTLNGGAALDYRDTPNPVSRSVGGLNGNDTLCLYVVAYDALLNATGPNRACATAVPPPPAPAAPSAGAVRANPAAYGLAGLDSWFWLDPALQSQTTQVVANGYTYQVTMSPSSVAWTFGDGASENGAGAGGGGQAYPAQSQIIHRYETQSQTGYQVTATVTWQETWTVTVGGQTYGPYAGGTFSSAAAPLAYPVQQAQPDLLTT